MNFFSLGTQSCIWDADVTLDAVSGVGPERVVAVGLAGDDAHVEVVLGAVPAVRAVAQRAHVHLVGRGTVAVLPHAEQPARLLALTPKLLKEPQKNLMTHRTWRLELLAWRKPVI